MEAPESNLHSFIVRLWLEETDEETGRAVWRGYITHVPSGTRRYLTDLSEIAAFIAPYLGVEEERRGWWRRWWAAKRWLLS
jgi:hypothetical protein